MEIYGVIYRINNKINKKNYIGKTTDKKGFYGRYAHAGNGIERVFKCHLRLKNNGFSYNKHLLNSISKYGFDNFEIHKQIDVAFSKEELDIKEQCWIAIYDSFKNGYNNTYGGEGTKGVKRPKGHKAYRTTKVICLNDMKIFNCIIDASNYYDVSKTSISSNCSENIDKHTVEQKDGTKLVFMYYDKYINTDEDEINKLLNYKYIPNKSGKVYNARKVYCSTNGKVFDSISEAESYYNTNNIARSCRKKGGFSGIDSVSGKRLQWFYYEDAI